MIAIVWADIFLYCLISFCGGVGAASLAGVSPFLFFLTAMIAAVLFFIGLAGKKHRIAIAGILAAFFIAGFWRFDAVWQKIQDSELAKINQNQTETEFTGIIKTDPVLGQNSQQLMFQSDNIDGKILVFAARYPEYRYGDKIKFTARLVAPEEFNGFDYPNYLAKSGVYSTARYPAIELVSRGNASPVYAGLLAVKHRLQKSIAQSLPSPQSDLLAAILFGDQASLEGCTAKEIEADPACMKLKEKLNISGLRHLSAVSGTHVTIMAMVLAPFFIGLGFWRQKALWLTIAFVWLFVAMIGLPASAVRAAIMGSLMILARIIGRPGETMRIIAIAAALMIAQNPLVLRFDIGFQLSFLAVAGMAVFCAPVQRRLKFIRVDWIQSALATALSAQIFTLPILIYNFGYVPTYSLLANVLVEPLVVFITIYGFALAVFGALFWWLGWVLATPMWLALSYLLAAADFFARLPLAKIEYRIDFIWFVCAYGVLIYAALKIKEKEKLRFLDF